jgi:non-ribosomal peptide synthetase component F
MEKSLETIIGLLGILKAGGAYVPLDPANPKDRLAFMIEDANVPVLLTLSSLPKSLPNQKSQLICLDSDWPVITQFHSSNPQNRTRSNNLAYIIYTSGSTGIPKGVMIEHRSLNNFLLSMLKQPGLSKEDVLLSVTTISFDISALELYLPLICGARVVLTDRTTATDARLLSESLNSSGATVMQATPSTWQMLIDSNWKAPDQLAILCGG